MIEHSLNSLLLIVYSFSGLFCCDCYLYISPAICADSRALAKSLEDSIIPLPTRIIPLRHNSYSSLSNIVSLAILGLSHRTYNSTCLVFLTILGPILLQMSVRNFMNLKPTKLLSMLRLVTHLIV